jgi:diguanylate cyclase (GGDEF)-like protein
MSKPPSSRFAVFGSAHLDIISDSKGHADARDRPGEMNISIGGTAHNIARNLRALGHEVSFGTILSDTHISLTIVADMQKAGIRMHAELRQGLPEAGFSAHTCGGEIVSAVSSCPIENLTFDDQHVSDVLAGADHVVADCNLSTAALRSITKAAFARRLPVSISGVSEPKAIKVLDLLGQGRSAKAGRKEPGALLPRLFLNKLEFDALVKTMVQRNRAFDGSRRAALETLLGGFEHVVETCGAEGVRIWSENPDAPVAAYVPENPENVGGRKTTFWVGAGDHLMSETLHRLVGGTPVPVGAREASRIVSARAELGGQPDAIAHLRGDNPIETRFRTMSNAAYTDALTQLKNRAGLQEHIDGRAPDSGTAVLMIDLDKFKSINDNHGHDAGDAVLREMGRILASAVREADCACRWGGEELIVLMDTRDALNAGGTGLDAAMAVAERIRATVEATSFRCGRVTCSIGVAAGRLDAFDDLREIADKALYVAKENGRNQVRSGH